MQTRNLGLRDFGKIMINIERFKKFFPGENTMMVVIACFIGVAAGGGNIAFRTFTDLVREFIFHRGHEVLGIDKGGWHLALLPLLPIMGMVLLIPLSMAFPGEVNGYGFIKFLRKVNIEGGVVKFRTIILKILSCGLTIGSGGSAGVEGPIAQVGGALGSQVGHVFNVSESRMKVYIAAGSAGAIGAVFNAPIAGIFFAAEIVLLGTYEISSFSALVISSAVATVITRAYYGASPTFPVPAYHLLHPLVEIPLYIVMGVVVGFIAVFHIKAFYAIRDRFAAFKIHPQLKPILGALIVGSIGIAFPQVLSDGYPYIDKVLTGQGVMHIMLALIFLKIIATCITLGSGGAGGMFAPALFIGSVIGGSFGGIVHHFLPTLTADPGAYAAVGIGAFLAALTHSPLTSIFLLFEMTGNYLIIIPIMMASIIGTIVAHWLDHDSIDTVDFTREGIDLHEGREVAVMKSIKVRDIISEDVDFISEKANVDQLLSIFSLAKDSFYFPVLDDSGRMTGVISLKDVKSIIHDEELRHCATVGNICSRKVITLTPDDNLYTAMTLFDVKGIEEIPVVESSDNKWVVGMLKRRDVIDAYKREVLKRGVSRKTAAIGFN